MRWERKRGGSKEAEETREREREERVSERERVCVFNIFWTRVYKIRLKI